MRAAAANDYAGLPIDGGWRQSWRQGSRAARRDVDDHVDRQADEQFALALFQIDPDFACLGIVAFW